MSDMIIRSELLKQFPTNMENPLWHFTEIRAAIEAAPAVDAVPVVHAEWILKHVGVGHYWQCSACHTNPCIYVTENTKFYPNCGARMDGESEEDT